MRIHKSSFSSHRANNMARIDNIMVGMRNAQNKLSFIYKPAPVPENRNKLENKLENFIKPPNRLEKRF